MRQFAVIGRRGKVGPPCTEATGEAGRGKNSQAHGPGGGTQRGEGPTQGCPFS